MKPGDLVWLGPFVVEGEMTYDTLFSGVAREQKLFFAPQCEEMEFMEYRLPAENVQDATDGVE